MAEYAHTRLRRLGIDAKRGAHAFTVDFPPLPAALGQRWVMPSDDRHGHIICMPQVTKGILDHFLSDVESAFGRPRRGWRRDRSTRPVTT